MFSVNLVFIVTNLYGWLLKRFYVPEVYKENIDELYPAQRSVAGFYLLQLFEVPYLLMVGQPEALFYVNGTALLVFSSFILVMVENYFFPKDVSIKERLLFLLPMWACWVVLLLPVFQKEMFTAQYQRIMTIVVIVVFMGYLFFLNRIRLKLVRRMHEVDEDEYSNEDDFPVKFALSIKWLPLVLIVLLTVTFLLNDALVKMVRDVIFTVFNVWFIIFTLNPHRKIKTLPMEITEPEEEVALAHRRLTEEQCKELETKMMDMLKGEKLFLEDHFTMSDLVKRMNTNKTYLSEVISNSEYGSFYQLINTLRIDHACQMFEEDSSLKMEQVALASGFSSGSAFSQVFKRIKGVSPSEYLRK
jgi:AraC-like DNA-binding protein